MIYDTVFFLFKHHLYLAIMIPTLLKDSDYLESRMYESINLDGEELIKLLVSSIKTAKSSKK